MEKRVPSASCHRTLRSLASAFRQLQMKRITLCFAVLLFLSLSFSGPASSREEAEDCLVNRYSDFHRTRVEKLRSGEAVKMLVYVCKADVVCGGVGDRISGMLSVLYAAIAMERLFIIDSTHPLPLSATLSEARVRWDLAHLIPPSPSNTSFVAINSIDRRDELLDELFAAHEAGIQVIYVRVNRYHVAMNLWSNAHWTSKSSYSGLLQVMQQRVCPSSGRSSPPTPALSFHVAFEVLFNFSPEVLDRVAEMQSHLGIGRVSPHYVAMHARIGGESDSWSDPVRHRLGDSLAFLECALSKLSTLQKGKLGKVVVFSDNLRFKQEISHLDDRVKYFQDSVLLHVDISKLDDHKILHKGTIDTYAELYLLSRAECIIGSQSTFSGVGGSIYLPFEQRARCYSPFYQCNLSSYDFWLFEGLK